MKLLRTWFKRGTEAVGRQPQSTLERLPSLYREMHEKQLFVGLTWKNSYDLLRTSIPDLERYKIVDFGCGPRGGLREALGPERVISYDPYVEVFSESPWDQSFDVLFSSDVLEHLPLQAIQEFTTQVARCAPKYIFLNISTRSAEKSFSDGANVHLTVQPTRWWQETLSGFWGKHYECRVLRDQIDECTLLFSRS